MDQPQMKTIMLQAVFKQSRNGTCNKMFTHDQRLEWKGKKKSSWTMWWMTNIQLVSCLGGNRIKINERMPLQREGHGRGVRRGSCEKEMKRLGKIADANSQLAQGR